MITTYQCLSCGISFGDATYPPLPDGFLCPRCCNAAQEIKDRTTYIVEASFDGYEPGLLDKALSALRALRPNEASWEDPDGMWNPQRRRQCL
jgi:hypothetical protein